jgi:hypothetical protein
MVLFRSSFIGMVCLFVIAQWGAAEGFRPGHISGVHLTPNGKQVVIQCDARPGPHSDFVIGSPNRLVIDFEGAGLLRAPRKIRVNRVGVREIRLGHFGSRARVVIDFGANPVPRYELRPGEKSLVVSLAGNAGSLSAQKRRKTPKQLSHKLRKPRIPHKAAAKGNGKTEALSIKSARVTDGLVVVELADRNDPRKHCRVVLDVDPGRLRVRRATLSDANGNLRSFNLSKPDRYEDSASVSQENGGPRRQAEEIRGHKKKFEWGMPRVKAVAPTIRQGRKRGPVRLERVQLSKRLPAEES